MPIFFVNQILSACANLFLWDTDLEEIVVTRVDVIDQSWLCKVISSNYPILWEEFRVCTVSCFKRLYEWYFPDTQSDDIIEIITFWSIIGWSCQKKMFCII